MKFDPSEYNLKNVVPSAELKKQRNMIYKLDRTNPKFKSTHIVPLEKCVSFIGSQMSSPTDPLTSTARQLLDNPNLNDNDTSLYRFYQNFRPRTYAEVFHVESKFYKGLSSHSFFYPWLHERYHPIRSHKDMRLGLFGPKHDSHVEHRVIRLKNLLKTLKKHDYRPGMLNDVSGGYVTGYYLYDEKGDYRFVVVRGHHRVASLIALGKTEIPVLIDSIGGHPVYPEQVIRGCERVDLKNINNWPGVKSGQVTVDDARDHFNAFFRQRY